MRLSTSESRFNGMSRLALLVLPGSFMLGIGYHLYLVHHPVLGLSAAVGAGIAAVSSLALR